MSKKHWTHKTVLSFYILSVATHRVKRQPRQHKIEPWTPSCKTGSAAPGTLPHFQHPSGHHFRTCRLVMSEHSRRTRLGSAFCTFFLQVCKKNLFLQVFVRSLFSAEVKRWCTKFILSQFSGQYAPRLACYHPQHDVCSTGGAPGPIVILVLFL